MDRLLRLRKREQIVLLYLFRHAENTVRPPVAEEGSLVMPLLEVIV